MPPKRQAQPLSEAGERVKEKAKEAGDKVKEQGRTFLNEQKDRVGSEIGTYSAAARRAAERLESESDTNLSSYVSSAADQLDRLATRVQERDLGELIDDVEEMARRRPEVFYGGMFVAGLVARAFPESFEGETRSRTLPIGWRRQTGALISGNASSSRQSFRGLAGAGPGSRRKRNRAKGGENI